MLWTVPRRVHALFYYSARLTRRVASHRASIRYAVADAAWWTTPYPAQGIPLYAVGYA